MTGPIGDKTYGLCLIVGLLVLLAVLGGRDGDDKEHDETGCKKIKAEKATAQART